MATAPDDLAARARRRHARRARPRARAGRAPGADAPLVAVTGVTGYVGGRLVPELLAAGYRVRAIARHPERLRGRPWYDDVEVVPRRTPPSPSRSAQALDGVDVAYYLIHSLGSGRTFEATRPAHRADVRAGRARGRRRADRLPRRAVPRGRGPLAAPGVAHRGRRDPAGLRRADHRAARRRDPRLGLGVVRDDALPHRAAAGDDRAALGGQPHPADRDPRRAALPRRVRRDAARREPRLRHRRAGRADLPRDDAALRAGRRAAPAGDRRRRRAHAAAVEPVGLARHARARRARAAARRVAGARGRLRRARHRRATSPTRPSGLIGFDRAVRLALRRVQEAAVDHALVVGAVPGRAERPAARPTRTGRAARCTSTSAASRSTRRPRRCGA